MANPNFDSLAGMAGAREINPSLSPLKGVGGLQQRQGPLRLAGRSPLQPPTASTGGAAALDASLDTAYSQGDRTGKRSAQADRPETLVIEARMGRDGPERTGSMRSTIERQSKAKGERQIMSCT